MSSTVITAEPNSTLISITRTFDAPRELVYRAYTDPTLIPQWLGPRNLTTRIEQYDLRNGGVWRYVSVDPDGGEWAFRGVFHGDPSVDAITQTFEFEGTPGHVCLETATFEEADGRTTVRTLSAFQSVADRDGMVESGMEVGVTDGHERLDEVLRSLLADAAR